MPISDESFAPLLRHFHRLIFADIKDARRGIWDALKHFRWTMRDAGFDDRCTFGQMPQEALDRKAIALLDLREQLETELTLIPGNHKKFLTMVLKLAEAGNIYRAMEYCHATFDEDFVPRPWVQFLVTTLQNLYWRHLLRSLRGEDENAESHRRNV